MGIANIQLILKNCLMNKIFNTKFKDLKIIKIESFKDKRELFFGVLSHKLKSKFIYDYTSISKRTFLEAFTTNRKKSKEK